VITRKKRSRALEKRKHSRDAVLMRGTEELLAAGIDLEVLEPTAASVTRLKGLPAPSMEMARAIACWLGFTEIPEAATMLAEWEETAQDKDLKREVRRSLFRLEHRGVAVPQRTAGPAASPVLTREEDRGYLSPLDGRGDQIVWYVKAERGGDYYVLSGVVNDRRGLVDSDAGRVARPALRELLDGARKRFSLRLLPAEAAYCDLILQEAYRSSASKRDSGVARFPSYRMEITHRIPQKIPCPVHAKLDDAAVLRDPGLLASSGRLLEEPELAGWLLEPEWMAPHLEAIREVRESPLVLNQYQSEERLARLIDTARTVIFGGAARAIYHRRLEMMAYYFLLDGREESARRALAVSLALAQEGAGEEAGSFPFASDLTHRSFSAFERAEKERAEEERRTSLIVKPGER